MELGKYAAIVERARRTPRRVCMVGGGDRDDIESLCRAAREGLISKCLLVGEFANLDELATTEARVEVIEATAIESCWLGARLTGAGEADVLVKGKVKSSEFLRAVLDRGSNLRTDSILSHIAVLDVPALNHLIAITDGGLNIAPHYEQKQAIIANGVACMRALGIERPHVALLAATESVTPAMSATTDADRLAEWAQHACADAVVEGPLAFDLAVSLQALRRKGIDSRLGGRADVWMMPSIECGNMVAKCLISFAGALMAGVVMGARAPLVLTSRADQAESKLVSLAVAAGIVRDGEPNCLQKNGPSRIESK